MEDKIKDLLSSCSEVDFGPVSLSDGENEFCTEMNNEIIFLCKSLPESTQIDALLFLMSYARTSFGQSLNFFKNYYVPTWSIIYWLTQFGPDDKALKQKDIKNAKTAHSMAMFLHSLDDHLNDSELPVTHLTLLLRSQSWMIMNNAFTSLADGVNGGHEIIRGFIDDYYYSIRGSDDIESLNSYCDLFRKQMATGLIVPVLITKKMTADEKFTGSVRSAYESFGIAWRLLDDIRDIKTDMMKAIRSSIYICLPKDIKNWWGKDSKEKIGKKNSYAKATLNYILENSVIHRIKQRICTELESAASIAEDYDMTGLADEFRCLLRPLMNRQNRV